MGCLASPILAGVETVNGFLAQRVGDLLIAVLRDRAEGVVLIELVQHLVNLFKARRDLRDTLPLHLKLCTPSGRAVLRALAVR